MGFVKRQMHTTISCMHILLQSMEWQRSTEASMNGWADWCSLFWPSRSHPKAYQRTRTSSGHTFWQILINKQRREWQRYSMTIARHCRKAFHACYHNWNKPAWNVMLQAPQGQTKRTWPMIDMLLPCLIGLRTSIEGMIWSFSIHRTHVIDFEITYCYGLLMTLYCCFPP